MPVPNRRTFVVRAACGEACTVSGAGLTVLAGRARLDGVTRAGCRPAGSLPTRFGFDAGMASDRDPKYTVVPQSERLAKAPATTRYLVTRSRAVSGDETVTTWRRALTSQDETAVMAGTGHPIG